ncbi:ABC transporter ATP-binding protein [Streptomyces sp. NRRL S-350]|uniref:ABC transporter ATP-binding protein n=1 Tax=Streptomyces sp. NRRL S-350 TaxID=1463902 RepID=UPI000A5E34A6|nr:ATP-binding cassette domain-containing protein [Streptomyces sp. NRRL S-350]
MIEVRGLSKRFGEVVAVDDLTFTVRPGEVTGFLGPNGAGKTTTLRMILGLDTPTAGTVSFDGRRFADLPAPLRQVGALLDARAVHPSRTATQHLLVLAHSNGIDPARVPAVLETVGLERAAHRPTSGYSLGMLQRLGLAAALLGDPPVLILDEPLNGLDPEGIVWFRGLMRELAAEGRTVLVSSHLMAEMALTADHLLVVGGGRLLADMSVEAFTDANAAIEALVRTPDATAFGGELAAAGGEVRPVDHETLKVTGLDSARIGALAAESGVILHELSTSRRSLEEAFMALTGATAQYSAAAVPGADGEPGRPAHPARGKAPAHTATASAASTTRRPPTFGDLVRSEWVKLRTTKSGRYLTLGTVVAGVGLAVLTSNSAGEQYASASATERHGVDPTFDPTEISLRGHLLAQLTISLLGAQAMTAEYNTGTITSSLTAVPDRGRLLAAKAVVVGAAALPVGLAATVGGFLGGQRMLARHGAPHARLSDPRSLRAVLGGGLYLASAGLLGLGVGGLLRSTSGSATSLFGVTLILPAFSPTLPGKLAKWVATYWPTRAGAQIMTVHRDPGLMRPWPGLGVMCAVTGGVLGSAYLVFRHRDA